MFALDFVIRRRCKLKIATPINIDDASTAAHASGSCIHLVANAICCTILGSHIVKLRSKQPTLLCFMLVACCNICFVDEGVFRMNTFQTLVCFKEDFSPVVMLLQGTNHCLLSCMQVACCNIHFTDEGVFRMNTSQTGACFKEDFSPVDLPRKLSLCTWTRHCRPSITICCIACRWRAVTSTSLMKGCSA